MATIIGTSSNNKLYGTDDDDLFAGLAGNDTINGGIGTDTVWYSGILRDYTIGTSGSGGYLTLADRNTVDGDDGTDSLSSIEQLAFSDSSLQITSSEFLVNNYNSAWSQPPPSVTALADGGFVVTWTSNDGNWEGIYGQRYDANGVAMGGSFLINTYTDSSQEFPSMTALADGGFVVTWQSWYQESGISGGIGIYGQRFDANGVKAGSEFQVNTCTANHQDSPSVAALPDGGFVVTWESWDQDGDWYGVYGQRYDANGVAVGIEFPVNSTTANFQGYPSITGLVDGGFVVTWQSNDQGGDGAGGIYGQRYDANSNAVGTEFHVNTYTTSDQAAPSVTALADGGFVVTWQSGGQDGDGSGIYGQRYDANGVKAGSEFRVNTYTAGDQNCPSVIALVDGGFVVTWQSYGQDGDGWGIYGQRYSANGLKAGSEFQINTYTTGDQKTPSVTALDDGGFVVTWQTGAPASGSIYSRRYDAQGNPLGLTVTGTAEADVLNIGTQYLLTVDGAGGNDIINGGPCNDTLLGGTGNDILNGGNGDDYLDGGTGNDTMAGGNGSDTYIVDSSLDIITETGTSGSDTVMSSVSYTLGATLENLTLTGSGNINGTGNASGNLLKGNGGNNILNGMAGGDMMIGGAGNDTYYVDSRFDIVMEITGQGTDTVMSSFSYTLGDNFENLTLTGTAVINGTGNALDNEIIGNTAANVLNGGLGNDILNGGLGADTMIGSEGNDTYFVDTTLDVVTEAVNEGTDRVKSSISYTLGNNVEDLYLTGAIAINGTGNALDNYIIGNTATNVLNGGLGTDFMAGALGNDTYVVDNPGDVVWEAANEGTDLVQSSISYTLGNNVENLTLTGTAAINGTGNTLNNVIIGNTAANVLDGGGGADILQGGGGNDTYIVDLTAAGAMQDTVIEALNAGQDTIQLRGTSTNTTPVTLTLGANLENLDASDTVSSKLNLTGNTLNNALIGNDAANILSGLEGNDTLDGGGGVDTLQGGLGDDLYIIDLTAAGAIQDTVTEAAAAGTDTIQLRGTSTNITPVTLTLGTNLENLDASGTIGSLLNLTGNTLNNMLIGNTAANILNGGLGNDILDGGIGADTMIGGDGSDTYIVDDAGDVVTETNALATGGIDLVKSSVSYSLGANVENLTLTGNAAINGTGNTLNNVIIGNTAANVLDGGVGIDTLQGGGGNDTYIVDLTAAGAMQDTVTEAAGAGTDTIQLRGASTNITAVTLALGANLENLDASGTIGSLLNLTGNTLNNMLTGNTAANILNGGLGDDILNGGSGADTMIGGLGNDTYFVDNAGDIVTEVVNEGTDLVQSSISYTLGSNVENLTLTGTAAINGIGNTLNNILTGNTAANLLNGGSGDDILNGGSDTDTLIGGLGNDTLTGGTGADIFCFDTALGVANVDHITDFSSGNDKISLSTAIFSALGGGLATGISVSATDSHNILYNITTGELFYNADGVGAGAPVLFAVLDNKPIITINDFIPAV